MRLSNMTRCTRCGIEREVKPGQDTPLCRDCCHVEADLRTLEIADMRDQGMSWTDIAQAVGMTPDSARYRLYEWNRRVAA